MKINKKYRKFVFSCLAAIFMSVPMAFFMVAINYGFRTGFMLAFLKSASVGVAVSLVLAVFLLPLAQKVADLIVEE